jgi:diguanylate cyclase (GGDEF)-like protein/PAS domain S-box-containing protein
MISVRPIARADEAFPRESIKMERERGINPDLEFLRNKPDPLKRLESEPFDGHASNRALERLKTEIQNRLGYIPPLLIPALESPVLLEALWRQQLISYYDNPLPQLFKEKLLTRLSRYCESSYFIVTHACMLHQLGMTAQEIQKIAGKLPPIEADIDKALEGLVKSPHPIEVWPGKDPEFEENVMTCCLAMFLGSAESERCAAALKDLLGSSKYAHLALLLANARASHLWIVAHPEIGIESLPGLRKSCLALIRNEPRLEQIFQNHREAAGPDFLRSSPIGAASGSEEHFRDMFENAGDIIYTHDFDGKFLSINWAVERIAGYTREEMLQIRITDVMAPEYAQVGRKMLDPQVAGEMPLTCELEILSKEGSRIALGISTRPVFRGGKAVAVQGIARDITRCKKSESALQESNRKLQASVQELEQRTREMALLDEMEDILRACLTTEEAYNVIVRAAQQIFPAKVGALYVIATSRNIVEAVAIWGDPAITKRSFSPADCWALRRGRTHWVENPRFGLVCRHVHHPSPDGFLCIPMMAQSETLGVLHLMQPENVKMTESKQRLAVTMSEHIAMALSNLKLHETLRSQSIRDPLTDLFNRRFMEESLELELRRASRNQRPLGMIMIDLDHFKYFNDTFGHEAGNLLLKELGVLLRTNIRGEDIACRYGGEEFMLILPEGSGAVTYQRAEFYKEAIRRLDLRHHGRPLGRITASMGVAIFPEHGRTGKALIEAADKALYRSKNAGRDRVTMAG